MGQQVLILGPPRTGTQSLAEALIQLGSGPIYHMREVGKNDHQAAWIALLDRKFGSDNQQPVRPADLKEILDAYDGAADFPASIFVDELMEAYPDAKIILATRNEDAWAKSMLSTLWDQYTDPNANRNSPMRPLAGRYHQYCWADDFPAHGRQYFREYYRHARQVAPRDRLLEYDVGQGWEPLCHFLSKDIPTTPFPRQDDWAAYKKAREGTGSNRKA